MVKNLPVNAGDTGSIPGPRRSHTSQSSEAHAPELLKPVCLEPVLCDKRSHQQETYALRRLVTPARHN